MFLIREKALLVAGMFAAASVVGMGCASSKCPCLRAKPPAVSMTPVPLANEPVADEATQLRGFQKSVAFYESGATQAWPTRWYYAPNPDYTTQVNYVIDPFLFIAQSASLPVTLAMEPPFRQAVIYSGDVLPPTYTAAPPLPPEQPVSRNTANPDPLSKPPQPVAPPLPPIPVEHPPLYVAPAPRPAMKAPRTTPASSPTTRPS